MATTIFTSTHDVPFHDAHGSIATAKDVKVGENIIPFPHCLACKICKPSPLNYEWEGTTLSALDKEVHLLTEDSYFFCVKGGGIVDFVPQRTGQNKIVIEGKIGIATGAEVRCTMAGLSDGLSPPVC